MSLHDFSLFALGLVSFYFARRQREDISAFFAALASEGPSGSAAFRRARRSARRLAALAAVAAAGLTWMYVEIAVDWKRTYPGGGTGGWPSLLLNIARTAARPLRTAALTFPVRKSFRQINFASICMMVSVLLLCRFLFFSPAEQKPVRFLFR